VVTLPIIIRGGQPEYVAPFWLALIGWVIGALITGIVYAVIYTGLTLRWIWRQGQVAYRRLGR
jgi:hypothetical protein